MSQDDGIYKLYWNNTHVGDVRNPHWSDFPWVTGDFSAVNLTGPLGELLVWFGQLAEWEEDLPDPPFAQELMENWFLETPEGERTAISIPILDKKAETITWR